MPSVSPCFLISTTPKKDHPPAPYCRFFNLQLTLANEWSHYLAYQVLMRTVIYHSFPVLLLDFESIITSYLQLFSGSYLFFWQCFINISICSSASCGFYPAEIGVRQISIALFTHGNCQRNHEICVVRFSGESFNRSFLRGRIIHDYQTYSLCTFYKRRYMFS